MADLKFLPTQEAIEYVFNEEGLFDDLELMVFSIMIAVAFFLLMIVLSVMIRAKKILCIRNTELLEKIRDTIKNELFWN
jgi:hypothetical protein